MSKVHSLVVFLPNQLGVGEIDRPTFEKLCATHMIPKILQVIQKAVDGAGLKVSDLFSLEIVGGAVLIALGFKMLSI